MDYKKRVAVLHKKIEELETNSDYSDEFYEAAKNINNLSDEDVNYWFDYHLTILHKKNSIKTFEQALAYHKRNWELNNEDFEIFIDLLKEYFENHK